MESSHVLPIHSLVCLTLRLAKNLEVESCLPKLNYYNKTLIVAPVSNAQSDCTTDFNTEGTHWNLVIVNLKSYEFIHSDSMPALNVALAIDLCKKFNEVLKFKKFKLANVKNRKTGLVVVNIL